MSVAPAHDRLQLPESLQGQLDGFRRRVWGVKSAEAASLAAFGVLVAFLLMFAVDRVWDTPLWARGGLFAVAAAACASRRSPCTAGSGVAAVPINSRA